MHNFHRWAVGSMVLVMAPARLISAQSAPITPPPVTRPVISTVQRPLADSSIALAVREQLVDSLVSVATVRSDEAAAIQASSHALSILHEAARKKTIRDAGPDLLPRLSTIALSEATGVQWVALRAIADLPDTARSITTLAQIAQDPRPVALFAVVELNKLGAPGASSVTSIGRREACKEL